MKPKIDIFMFIDAMGWEVIKGRGFLEDMLAYRRPAGMQFGYSSTAIPTILTGTPPIVHKHLSFYYYAPDKSPFKAFHLLGLGLLPEKIAAKWRLRHVLSKCVAKAYGFTGYFEMYAMSFKKIHYFDYIEKTDIFVPGGLSPTPNLADRLSDANVPYHISNWRLSEQENIDALLRDIEKEDISFAFLYTAAMDGLLHMVTKNGAKIPVKLDWYSSHIRKIADTAAKHYREISISVFSDHGMTSKSGVEDIMGLVEKLGFRFGKDYAAVYDSTMSRFWFLNDRAREELGDALTKMPRSRVLSEAEKIRYGINFADNMYGEAILLMDPGVQIEPCDMGLKALPGMHGFAPEHEDSYAAFLSTGKPSSEPNWVGDYFKIMTDSFASRKENPQ